VVDFLQESFSKKYINDLFSFNLVCVLVILLTSNLFIGCKTLKQSNTQISQMKLDVQGHRGCRGLYPENTIAGFKHAYHLGVSTLELDVVVSKDSQIIISHEPFFSHLISTGPENQEISEQTEHSHKIYELDYEDIKAYDVGLKDHPGYPNQIKLASFKPSLIDMVKELDALSNNTISYNIELKRRPEWDLVFLPPVEEFVDLFLSTIEQLDIGSRLTIQSFDRECLRLLKSKTDIPLVYLIENEDSIEQNIQELGFKPNIYSPYFKLIDSKLITYCKREHIRLIPWTINSEEDMKAMLDLGIEGIITDYPNLLISLVNQTKGIEVLR